MRAALILAAIPAIAIAQDDPAGLRRAAQQAQREARGIEAQVRAQDRAADRALDEAARAAARVATAAERASAARLDVARIDAQRARQAERLAAERAPLARLVAALQVMARRPQALAVAAPGSTADLVHVRLALDAAVPEITRRTARLRAEIAERDRLRLAAISAVRRRDAAIEALTRERAALLRLADERRAEAADLSGQAMAASDRALALGADAREAALAADRASAAQAVSRDLARIAPPMPLGRLAAPGLPRPLSEWRMPVSGRVITGFGEITANGVRSRGVTLAPMRGATVRAPDPGRVAWAGAFRGQGDVVILAHSGGRTSLVVGLSRLSVREGQLVAQGMPLGTAGRRVTIELRAGEVPVDLAAQARQPSARAPYPVSSRP